MRLFRKKARPYEPKDERWLPEPLARVPRFDVNAALKEEGPLPPKTLGGSVVDPGCPSGFGCYVPRARVDRQLIEKVYR